jgi:hypothetical protein
MGLALTVVLQATVIFSIYYFDASSAWGDIFDWSALFLPFVAYYLILYHTPAFMIWSRAKRFIVFAPSSLVVAIVGFCFFNIFWFTMSFPVWPWERYLPSEGRVRQQFESHKTDYTRLVALLQKDPSLADGEPRGPMVAEYKDLIHEAGIKFVFLREDGSIEFVLGGYGCAICSDSYVGMRYLPKDHKIEIQPGWVTPTVVASLDSAKLPQSNGEVTSGLYVIPIEPEWFIYRLEIQE